MSTRTCPSCGSPLPPDAAYCDQCGSATHTQIIGETPAGPSGAATSYEAQPERLARALGPQYQLGRLIGRGGYAEVFQVRDTKLKRDLAIKVIRPDLIVTPALLARFRREALAVGALQHPAIVPVYDVGEADGICFIVMPLVRGESLKSVLLRQRRLPVDEVQRIVLETANALAVAHQANVVHRDIKPENIMLDGAERHVRVMDFGIAKAVDSSDKELTGTGVVVGTPQYMSPEQASGEPTIDARSDQYSLAVLAYQMLSGRPPFEGETARAIIVKQLLDPPPQLGTLVENLPGHIAAALHRALQKSPANRFPTIREFAAALQDPEYRNPPELEQAAAPDDGAPVPERRRAVPWLVGGIAVVLTGVALTQWRPSAPVTSPPVPAAEPAPAPPPSADSAPGILVPPAPPPAAQPPAAPIVVVDTVFRAVPAPAPAGRPDSATASPPPPGCAVLIERRELEAALGRCIEEASGGDPRAARHAADLLVRRGTAADSTRAAVFYDQAATAGNDPQAQFIVARRSEATDPSWATEMYRRAAENHYREAYPHIASRLYIGLGTARDLTGAARWFKAAAEAGNEPSQLRLAGMYADGQGVARSDSAARVWYQRAAENNSAEGQYRLALLYFRGGRGVPRSESEGMRWLERAASQGHADAVKELARRRG